MKRKNCKATRRGDMIICSRCGVNWDADDKDPPQCRDIQPQRKAMGIWRSLVTDNNMALGE